MKPFHSRLPLLSACLLSIPARQAQAQTIAEALDTPGIEWAASGTVTPLEDPGLSHDGVDVLRINPVVSGSPWSVQTTVTVPSVVEFWHRSQDLKAITRVGRNKLPAATSSAWKKERWVQFPASEATPGILEIGNAGPELSGPLFLDQFTVIPAAQVSLAEALDFPGFTGSSTTVAGLAESWLSPDGVDAVVFAAPGAILNAPLPGPGLIRFRQSGGDLPFPLEIRRSSGEFVQVFVENGLSWAWIPSAGDYQIKALEATVAPVIFSQKPIVMDALELLEEVPVAHALDAPDLTFSTTGKTIGTGPASGSPNGDAVVCMGITSGGNSSSVSLPVSGPCMVQFSFRGRLDVSGLHVSYLYRADSTAWQTIEIPVYETNDTIQWNDAGSVFWLDEVKVLPLPPEMFLGALLDAPGLVPEILNSASLKAVAGEYPGDSALFVSPAPQASLLPVVRLPFHGPGILSLNVADAYLDALIRIDGGAWQKRNYNNKTPFRAVVSGSGPHNLEVAGSVVLDHFQVIPLTPVPLAEALDAPELLFTTPTGMPWAGYSVPTGAGFLGDHAAFGGDHATSGDPWIETQVTGPGILRSTAKIHAGSPGTTTGLESLPKLLIDGVLPDPWYFPSEVPIGPGLHTVRWVQSGSQVSTGSGTLATLDAVSFESMLPIPVSTALDTPGRTWMVGSNGQVLPLARPTLSPDGVDSVHLLSGSVSDTAWLETVVNLPCRLFFSGKHIQVSIGNGPPLFTLLSTGKSSSNPQGFLSLRPTLAGQGTALIRFRASSPWGVLDAVDFEAPNGQLTATAAPGPGELSWSIYGGKAWQVVPQENGVTERYRSPNENVWMETTVMGPCKLDFPYSTITLPDHENRQTDAGWIPYPGPQRVRGSLPANTLLGNIPFRSTPPLESWTNSPELTWTTGGEVPWQSTFDSTVRSGVVRPGEISWIEAAVTGPGILYWDSTQIGGNTGVLPIFTCNDTVLGSMDTRAFVHVGFGSHRLRWTMANPIDGFPTAISVLTLRRVGFTPQPAQSVSSVLSGGVLNYLETAGFPIKVPVPWPSSHTWQIVDDATLPGLAMHDPLGSGRLMSFQPSRGSITSLVKMEGPTTQNPGPSIWEPAAGAPFPWLPWTSTFAFPQGYGSKTTIAQSSFVPDPPVSVGEALDQPSLTWTTGSNPPGLWQALTSVSSQAADKDALHLVHADMGDLAWLETTLTGPLRVSTSFDGTGRVSSTGIRILVDEVLILPENLTSPSTPDVIIPPGAHRLRWEIIPLKPIPTLSGIAITSIRTSPHPSFPYQQIAVPDVPALLDAPWLTWSGTSPGTNAFPMAAITTGTHDGVDALSLGANRLVAHLTGPGILSFWMKDTRLDSGVFLDSHIAAITRGTTFNWSQFSIPIPQGGHSLAIAGGSGGGPILDEFSFQSLPALAAGTALDAPPQATVSIPNPDNASAANYPGFGADDTGSLLLMPGFENRIALQVPPLCTVSLRVRSVSGSGTISFQDLTSFSTSTTWTTRSFSPGTAGGLNTFYLRAITVPVLLDNLTVSVPNSSVDYFPWAAVAGLNAGQQHTTADPDNDGMPNFTEYAFGLNPTVTDSGLTGTDTVPGLPEVSTFTATNGELFFEVHYWRRSILAATVETATLPSGTALLGETTGWSAADNAPTDNPRPGGWIRSVWRSPTPIQPGTRQFARIRAYVP